MATISPRPLLLNLSNESVDDALNLLKDSEEQEENQKREIKRLFTEALLDDKSGMYKKPLYVSNKSTDLHIGTKSHQDTAYSLIVNTSDDGNKHVTVFLGKGERAVKTKMKVQAQMKRSVLERLVTASNRAAVASRQKGKSSSTSKNTTNWTHPDIVQPVILLPKDQLWIGCAEQEISDDATFDRDAAGKDDDPDRLSLLVDTAYAKPEPFVLSLDKPSGGTDQKTLKVSLHDTPKEIIDVITQKSDSFDHPRPPPVRWTRSHVNLDAAGNYMLAWTTPFPIGDEVDAVMSQERIESLLTQVRKFVRECIHSYLTPPTHNNNNNNNNNKK